MQEHDTEILVILEVLYSLLLRPALKNSQITNFVLAGFPSAEPPVRTSERI